MAKDDKGNGPEKQKALSLEVRADGVAVITYDVPGEAVNTLQASFADDFEEVYEAVKNDARITAAVLVSGKKDTWVAGANIDMLAACKTAEDAEKLCRMGKAAMNKFEALDKPVVAAIHGAALGGGLELALVCAARVASDDPKTVLGLPEVQLGLLPGANGLQRLARLIGLQEALDMGLTGKNVRPAKAKKLGLVDEVVPRAILLDVAIQWAKKLAEQGKPKPETALDKLKESLTDPKKLAALALEETPVGKNILFKKAREMTLKKTRGHYPAAERIIDVLETYAKQGFEASSEVESKAFGELVVSDVAHRLMEIFHATNELKKENGTDDPNVKAKKVEKLGVLGAGLMGAGIAYVSSNAGIAVRLKDKDAAGLGRGLKQVREYYDERVKKKALTSLERDRKLALVTPTTDYSGFGNVDLVVEAVFEDLELKHRVVRETEAVVRSDTIFASNTSTIRIAKIAEAAKRPELVVGMHYFSPVNKMPLLEVITTEQTAPWVTATAVAVGKKQGKTVIVVRDGYGFYTSRILAPYMNEASYLLAEGVPIEEIDRALVDWGFPVGPITLMDEVGIDVGEKAGRIMFEAFGERMAPPPGFEKVIADGRKGRKNNKGFYKYEDGKKVKAKGRDVVDASIYSLLGVTPDKHMDKTELAERVALQMVGEAIRCLEEGILRSPRDGDIGAIFGLGFPPFRGGPFRYADSVGAEKLLAKFRALEAQHGARWAPPQLLVDHARVGRRFHGRKDTVGEVSGAAAGNAAEA
jgi:3-hydroxyacyl-CoA dehydrogenase/enoyl-CoA hydratase/3-hydroxybutyryl-CoA epimerase